MSLMSYLYRHIFSTHLCLSDDPFYTQVQKLCSFKVGQNLESCPSTISTNMTGCSIESYPEPHMLTAWVKSLGPNDWKGSCRKKAVLFFPSSFGNWTLLPPCFSLISTSAHFKSPCISSSLVIPNSAILQLYHTDFHLSAFALLLLFPHTPFLPFLANSPRFQLNSICFRKPPLTLSLLSGHATPSSVLLVRFSDLVTTLTSIRTRKICYLSLYFPCPLQDLAHRRWLIYVKQMHLQWNNPKKEW